MQERNFEGTARGKHRGARQHEARYANGEIGVEAGAGTAVKWAALGAGAAALLFAGRKAAMQAPTAMAGADWAEGLAREHAMVLKLLDKLEETDAEDVKTRRMLLVKVKAALTKHAVQEENVVYPALKEAGEASAVSELIEEHGDIKHHLYLFATLDVDTPDFRSRLSDFRALLSEHMEEEEQRLFPALKEQLGPDGNRKLAMAMNKEGVLAA